MLKKLKEIFQLDDSELDFDTDEETHEEESVQPVFNPYDQNTNFPTSTNTGLNIIEVEEPSAPVVQVESKPENVVKTDIEKVNNDLTQEINTIFNQEEVKTAVLPPLAKKRIIDDASFEEDKKEPVKEEVKVAPAKKEVKELNPEPSNEHLIRKKKTKNALDDLNATFKPKGIIKPISGVVKPVDETLFESTKEKEKPKPISPKGIIKLQELGNEVKVTELEEEKVKEEDKKESTLESSFKDLKVAKDKKEEEVLKAKPVEPRDYITNRFIIVEEKTGEMMLVVDEE